MILAEIITPASADYEYHRDRLLNPFSTRLKPGFQAAAVSFCVMEEEGGKAQFDEPIRNYLR